MNKAVPFQGIVRNLPAISVPDGAMQELINLRPRDGAWRPVAPKYSVLVGYSTLDLRYIHIVNNPTLKVYIGRKANGHLEYQYLSGLAYGALTEVATVTIDGNTEFTQYKNVLVVSNATSELTSLLVFNENDKTYLVFGGDAGTNWLPPIPSAQYFSDAVVADNETKVGGENIPINDPDAFSDLMEGEYLKMKSEKEALGYLTGVLLIRLAWELVDGTIVMQTVPEKIRTSELTTEPNPDGTFRCTTVFAAKKIRVKLFTTMSYIVDIQTRYKNIIKGLNVYVTAPRAPGMQNEVLRNEIVRIKKENLWGNEKVAGRIYRETNVETLTYYQPSPEKDFAYYLLKHIPSADLYNESQSIWVNGITVHEKNVTDIHTRSICPIGQFSHHRVHGNNLFTYNARVFFSNLKNYLFDQLYVGGWFSSVLNSSDHTAYKIGVEVDIAISAKKICTIFTGWDCTLNQWNVARTAVRFGLAYKDIAVKDEKGDTVQGDKYYFGYPDSRAREVRVLVTMDNGVTMKNVASIPLTSAADQNFAYAEGRIIEVVWSGLANYTLSTNENFYYDKDRIQASELSNPFFLPAINSYRIQGDVMGLSTNAIPLSQGQFGQYPVFAFCNTGIWALTIGNGEVLISSIQPLSDEVCNNKQSITQVDGGVLFTTEKGLHVIVGSQVHEISQPAEGSHVSPLANLAAYTAIMNNPNRYQASAYICSTSFLTYLKTAKIAWDYIKKEIIVTNSSKTYSWVYSQEAKQWFKISRTWKRFISNYPVMYGVRDVDNVEIMDDMTLENSDFVAFADNLYTIHLETRPMKFTGFGFKKLIRTLLQGFINNNEEFPFSIHLFGSTDMVNWYLLSNSTTYNSRSDMILGRTSFSCKYYIMVAGGQVDSQSYLNGVHSEIEDRYNNKLR